MIIQRTLTILDYLAHHPGSHGVREIAAEHDFSPSSTYRILSELVEGRYAHQDRQSGKYSIGAAAVQLGLAAMSGLELTTAAPVYLRELSDRSGETSFLAVLEDDEVVYLAKNEGSFAVRTSAQLGSRRPVHATALGRAMLSALPDDEVDRILSTRPLLAMTGKTMTNPIALRQEIAGTRIRGYAIDNEEVEEGLMCVGAPIRNRDGLLEGAVSVAGPISRMNQQIDTLGEMVRGVANELSAHLGFAERERSSAPTSGQPDVKESDQA